ncbi:MAG: hypothetical protein GF313_08945 [Caldithrix sp.]|nr:hypothetical protein [Caldithrix sp.]
MDHLLGISFSQKSLNIVSGEGASSSGPGAVFCKQFIYPFKFYYDTLFETTSIKSMVKLIRDSLNTDNPQIVIAVPNNYAVLKRVAIPDNSDVQLIKAQVKWELENTLSEPIENYKVIDYGKTYDYESYKERMFVCLHKTIMRQIMSMVNLLGGQLQSLILNGFAVENILEKVWQPKQITNALYTKVDTHTITHHLYINRAYYQTFIDKIKHEKKINAAVDKIADVILKRVKYVQAVVGEIPITKSSDLTYFLASAVYNSELLSYMNKNAPFNYEELEPGQFIESDQIQNQAECHLEALGALMEIQS